MPMVVRRQALPRSVSTASRKNADPVAIPGWNIARPDNEFELIAPEGISTRLIPQGRFVTNDPDDAGTLADRRNRNRLCAADVGDR